VCGLEEGQLGLEGLHGALEQARPPVLHLRRASKRQRQATAATPHTGGLRGQRWGGLGEGTGSSVLCGGVYLEPAGSVVVTVKEKSRSKYLCWGGRARVLSVSVCSRRWLLWWW
jgi:hypothetical protein